MNAMNAFHTPNPNALEFPQDIEQLTSQLRRAQQRLQQAEARILQLQTALDQAVAQKQALDQTLAQKQALDQTLTQKHTPPQKIDDPHSLSLSWLPKEIPPLDLLQETPRPFAPSVSSKEVLSLSWDLSAEIDGFFGPSHDDTQPVPKEKPIFPGDQVAFSPEKRAQFAALSAHNKSPQPPFAETLPQPLVSTASHRLQNLSEETIESSLRQLAHELKKSPTPAPQSNAIQNVDPMATFCDPDAAVKHFDQLQALRAVFAHKQAAASSFSSNKNPSQGDLRTALSEHAALSERPFSTPHPSHEQRTPPPPHHAPSSSRGKLPVVSHDVPQHVETVSSPFEPMPRRILPVDRTVDAAFQDILPLFRK